MKYQINQSNFNDFSIIGINKLSPRSFFVPYLSKKLLESTTLLDRRYKSDKVTCLNGDWDFKFYHNPNDLPLDFDTDSISFDKVKVPGCWQFQGYDRPFYLNTRYQFPFKDPYVPTLKPVGFYYGNVGNNKIGPTFMKLEDEYNFVGVYRTYINIKDITKKHIINFLGVCSCIDLYINGKFVGYSEGSHNPAEFDLSSVLVEGQNELLAVVHRWCNGSYLECQDMFRNNGIFRDVLLYEVDKEDVLDYSFNPVYKDGKYDAIINVKTYNPTNIKVKLVGNRLDVDASESGDDVSIKLSDLEVIEWNAEKPTLYDLYIETPTCVIKTSVGFKRVEIINDLFLVNGNAIKLKGVNHHDTSCKNGYTMSPEDILLDITTCKDYNINTIRTSHYPPDPLLLDLADFYGLYIVDEADIEAHGCLTSRFPPNFNYLSNNKKWEEHYLARGEAMFERDKNHTSIIMWSLGNEAGGYKNQDAMYAYFKTVSNLPVHYESVVHSKRKCYDVGSEMYPTQDAVELIGKHISKTKEFNDRPYFMCEYAHAMGVGPGAIEEYWEHIYKYDNLMGGCVWEMVDHAVLEKDGGYTYGGDHDEYAHDGNFCTDGLFYPDRSPSTGAKLVKFTYRPLRFRFIEGNKYEVFNTTGFTNANEYDVIINGKHHSFDIEPYSKKVVELDLEFSNEDKLVNIVVNDKNNKQVSIKQLVLSEVVKSSPVDRCPLPEDFIINENGKVSYGDLVSNDEYTLLYRAKTDNDNGLYSSEKNDVVSFYNPVEKVVSINRDDTSVTVKSSIVVGKMEFEVTDTYIGTNEGILLTSKIHTVKGKGFLPRFAKSFKLSSEYDDVSYYGRNGESYLDMKDYAQIEEVSCKVLDMVEPNVKPQESGNRMDTKYVSISNGKLSYRFDAVNVPFNLGVKPYSDKELIPMKHKKDEIRTGTYVSISGIMCGIGTGSCGPSTLKKYRYPMSNDYEFSFLIKKN